MLYIMKRIKFAALVLAGMMAFACAAPAIADIDDEINEVEWQTQQMAENLEEVGNNIANLEDQQNQLMGEISELDQQLVTTIASIDSLNEQIATKNQEIEVTTANLAVAENNRWVEYDAMKKRIQYLYERGGNAGWATILLEEQDITELLNQAEYTQKMYEYDRNCLENYVAIVLEVDALKRQLEMEYSELVAMKNELEQEQAYLESLLEQKRQQSAETGLQLDSAYAMAAEYRNIINELNYQYQMLIEEKERQAAAAAAAAAAEAARQAAEAEAARQAAEAAAAQNGGGGGGETGGGGATYDEPAPYVEPEPAAPAPSYSGPGNGSGSATAQAVVGYALQFVGYPYVYGGNSLTNGTDCSGFIHLVYAAFGISTPRSSAGFRYAGTPVSYSEAAVGDVICYDGHVALYLGGGAIVHASSPEVGIIISGDATYRPILTVRRFC